MSSDSAALAQAAIDALVNGTPEPWQTLRSDRRVPDAPGLYGVHAHDPELIGELQGKLSEHVGPGLVYVGRSVSLLTRVLTNHFAGNSAGSTLRFTLGCLLLDRLGLEPCQNPGNNPRFLRESEEQLTEWMRSKLRVTFWAAPSAAQLEAIERLVVQRLHPPLNDMESGAGGCCPAHDRLAGLRARAASMARPRPCR